MVSSPALKEDAAPFVRQSTTQLVAAYLRTKPVYVLRADASPQEATMRRLLKSIRIEAAQVVATLPTI